jgi:hypothetical protein
MGLVGWQRGLVHGGSDEKVKFVKIAQKGNWVVGRWREWVKVVGEVGGVCGSGESW